MDIKQDDDVVLIKDESFHNNDDDVEPATSPRRRRSTRTEKKRMNLLLPHLSKFELQRHEKMAKNEAMLKTLGLNKPKKKKCSIVKVKVKDEIKIPLRKSTRIRKQPTEFMELGHHFKTLPQKFIYTQTAGRYEEGPLLASCLSGESKEGFDFLDEQKVNKVNDKEEGKEHVFSIKNVILYPQNRDSTVSNLIVNLTRRRCR